MLMSSRFSLPRNPRSLPKSLTKFLLHLLSVQHFLRAGVCLLRTVVCCAFAAGTCCIVSVHTVIK